MKKFLSLCLCILLLSGCAVTYDGPTETRLALTEYTVTHYWSFGFEGVTYTDRTVYAYDIYGNRVREMAYRDGELQSVCNRKYDDRGNLISQKYWDHTKWIPLPMGGHKNTYDDRDRVLTTVYFDGWSKETNRSIYIYDDENGTRTYQDETGEILQTTWYDENGLDLRQTAGEYETVYEYDANGNLTGWISYHAGSPDDRYEARYDGQNRQIWGGRYNAADDLESETTWEYDDEANTVTTHRPNGYTRIEYYDADGRIHLIEDYTENGELSMVQQYYYQEILVPTKGAEAS